jgi:hypothetical protein
MNDGLTELDLANLSTALLPESPVSFVVSPDRALPPDANVNPSLFGTTIKTIKDLNPLEVECLNPTKKTAPWHYQIGPAFFETLPIRINGLPIWEAPLIELHTDDLLYVLLEMRWDYSSQKLGGITTYYKNGKYTLINATLMVTQAVPTDAYLQPASTEDATEQGKSEKYYFRITKINSDGTQNLSDTQPGNYMPMDFFTVKPLT